MDFEALLDLNILDEERTGGLWCRSLRARGVDQTAFVAPQGVKRE